MLEIVLEIEKRLRNRRTALNIALVSLF